MKRAPLYKTPAGRLAHLRSVANSNERGNRPGAEGWSYVLGTELRSIAELWRSLVWVIELPTDVERAVRLVPDIEPSDYLAWLDPLRSALNQMSPHGTSPRQAFGSLDNPSIALVLICHDQLVKHSPDGTDPERLSEIRLQIAEIASHIRTLDVPEPMRAHLLRLCDLLDRGICDGVAGGNAAIKTGLEATCGAMLVNTDLTKHAPTEVIGQVWDVLAKIATLMQLTDFCMSLPEQVIKLLPK